MKLTKKAAALLLAASLAVSVCATPVFAADNPPFTNETGVQTETGAQINSSEVNTVRQACTKLTYSVTETYKWNIPSDISFGNDKGVNQEVTPVNTPKTTVGVSGCKIKNGKTLHINMKGNGGGDGNVTSGNGEFKIKSAEEEKLDYEVKSGDTEAAINTTVTSGADVLTLDAGNDTLTKYLSFTLKTATGSNASEKAGVYRGYAIFTAQLKDTTIGG